MVTPSDTEPLVRNPKAGLGTQKMLWKFPGFSVRPVAGI